MCSTQHKCEVHSNEAAQSQLLWWKMVDSENKALWCMSVSVATSIWCCKSVKTSKAGCRECTAIMEYYFKFKQTVLVYTLQSVHAFAQVSDLFNVVKVKMSINQPASVCAVNGYDWFPQNLSFTAALFCMKSFFINSLNPCSHLKATGQDKNDLSQPHFQQKRKFRVLFLSYITKKMMLCHMM